MWLKCVSLKINRLKVNKRSWTYRMNHIVCVSDDQIKHLKCLKLKSRLKAQQSVTWSDNRDEGHIFFLLSCFLSLILFLPDDLVWCSGFWFSCFPFYFGIFIIMCHDFFPLPAFLSVYWSLCFSFTRLLLSYFSFCMWIIQVTFAAFLHFGFCIWVLFCHTWMVGGFKHCTYVLHSTGFIARIYCYRRIVWLSISFILSRL